MPSSCGSVANVTQKWDDMRSYFQWCNGTQSFLAVRWTDQYCHRESDKPDEMWVAFLKEFPCQHSRTSFLFGPKGARASVIFEHMTWNTRNTSWWKAQDPRFEVSTAKPSVQLLEARQLLFATATSQGYGDGTGWVGHKEKARGPDQKEASILLCLSSFFFKCVFPHKHAISKVLDVLGRGSCAPGALRKDCGLQLQYCNVLHRGRSSKQASKHWGPGMPSSQTNVGSQVLFKEIWLLRDTHTASYNQATAVTDTHRCFCCKRWLMRSTVDFLRSILELLSCMECTWCSRGIIWHRIRLAGKSRNMLKRSYWYVYNAIMFRPTAVDIPYLHRNRSFWVLCQDELSRILGTFFPHPIRFRQIWLAPQTCKVQIWWTRVLVFQLSQCDLFLQRTCQGTSSNRSMFAVLAHF